MPFNVAQLARHHAVGTASSSHDHRPSAIMTRPMVAGRPRTAKSFYGALYRAGYRGAIDSVQRYVRRWRREHERLAAPAFIPLSFAPGEAYQFDWSHEVVVLAGVTTKIKVAHIRLCHSRFSLAIAYLRETQEMVFDAHERAFRLFGGACTRGIYDPKGGAAATT